MNIVIDTSWTSRMAAALLAVSACFQQAGAAITSTDCEASGGVQNFGNCYVVDPTDRTWSDAQTIAQALDPSFHLVSIHSAVENTFVGSLFPSGDSFWIGLNDAAVEGTFVWMDGSPVDYTNWASGEPSDPTGIKDTVWFDNTIDQWVNTNGDTSGSVFRSVFSAPLSPVPVPAAVWLFGSGLIGLAGMIRKKRNHPPAGLNYQDLGTVHEAA